jgi:hypothetical protein
VSAVAILMTEAELEAKGGLNAPAEIPKLTDLFANKPANLEYFLRQLESMVRSESTTDLLGLFTIRANQQLDRARVYFIQAGGPTGPIKIGMSIHVEGRLKDLQAANPYLLNLLADFPGGRELEVTLHNWFGHLRVGGEWFLCAPELLGTIAAFIAGGEEIEALDHMLRSTVAA